MASEVVTAIMIVCVVWLPGDKCRVYEQGEEALVTYEYRLIGDCEADKKSEREYWRENGAVASRAECRDIRRSEWPTHSP